MKARKLPSGKWNVCVFSHKEGDKKKFVSFTAPTKQEVLRQALEFQMNKKDEAKPQSITIGKAIENYIQSKSNVVSPTTLREYKRYKMYYVSLDNIKIGSVDSLLLQNFVNDLSKDKSPKTVRNIYSLLISSIRLYSDRSFKITLPQKAVVERHIPDDAIVKELIAQANPKLRICIVLGSHGLRRGEICALKYKDVLRDFNAVYVHSDLVKDENKQWVHKEVPKTNSSTRRVILPKEVIDMLGTGNDEDYIIGIVPDTITSEFQSLRNKLGFKCRFHDLRHYMASILHAIGLPDTYIMERGGWSSDNVLKSVYRNSLDDKSAQFTALANKYYQENIMSESQKKSNSRTDV